jgi:membrane-associated phospholipid phosphatase
VNAEAERQSPTQRVGSTNNLHAESESGAHAIRFALLPHEIVFNAFLGITWIRLVLAGGALSLPGLAFLAYFVTSFAVIAWARANPTPLRWRIRLLFYPSIMGLAFMLLRSAMALIGTPKVDALLNGWDIALLGANLSVAWQGFYPPLLTDAMMAGYLFYFIYLVGGPATYCVRDLPKFRLLMVGLFTVHGLGFLGYTIWPAGGPHLHLTFDQPLVGTLFTRVMTPVVNGGSNGVDVFPSLHLAVSLYLLGFDWRFNRRRFWWVLTPCVVLWVSTIYLRYHYFVDLLAGAVLAAVGWAVAAWWEGNNGNQLEKV